MVIDERGENALTKYRGGKIVKADHHMLKLEMSLTFHMDMKHDKNKMFYLRNKACQKQFRNGLQIQIDLQNVLVQVKH